MDRIGNHSAGSLSRTPAGLVFFFPALMALAVLTLLPATLSARQDRQRVAVVLSGGGAKGVAHVGVLKALEEKGIPIDYIAGTSMGAIIGGMYASGFSPDSIEKIVTGPDFQNWALGIIEEEYAYYYKEPAPNASWVSLKFRVDSVWQPRLPTNLVSPVQMDFAGLQYLTSPNVASGGNFDSLFVPFRCVASDIYEKEAVVFRSGEIFPAIRASMTYPFIFRPIRVDGRLLFDGGIYNNFPVDVVESDFGPDLIIGSVVSANFPPPTEENIRSHIENMLVYKTDYSIDPEKGIVIRPTLPETGVTDFSHSSEFVDSGYVAAGRQMDSILQRVQRRVSLEEITEKRREFGQRKPPMVVERIFIRGLNEAQRVYVNRRLLTQGRPTAIEAIKPAYFKMLTEGHIESISPSALFNDQSGYYDLYLDIRLQKDLNLQFGGNLSSSPVNQTFVEARYNYLDYQAYTAAVGAYFGRFYSAVQLQGRIDFALPVELFLETTGSFNYFDYFKSSTTFFQDRDPAYIRLNQNYWDFHLGIPARYYGKLIAGFTAGRDRDDYYHANLFSRTDVPDQTRFHFITTYVQYECNTLNRKQFASSGSFFNLTGRYVSGTERHRPGTTSPNSNSTRRSHEWFQLRATYQNFFSARGDIRFGLFAEGNLSTQKLFTNFTSSLLSAPAFDWVPGTRTQFLPRYRAHSFAVVGLPVVYALSDNIELGIGPYLFQPYREVLQGENNQAVYGKILANRYLLLTSSLVANTPVGPLSVNFHFFDRNDNRFAFTIDFGYLIFNRDALR
jgi:NTE family protein